MTSFTSLKKENLKSLKIFILGKSQQGLLGLEGCTLKRKLNISERYLTFNTQILLASADELLKDLTSEYKSATKLTTKISVLNQYETIGLMECIAGCPYRITNVKWISIKGKYFKISKENFFRRVKETSKELIELAIHKTDFLEFRIRNQMQVNRAEIDPIYKNSRSMWEKLCANEDSANDESSLSETSVVSK